MICFAVYPPIEAVFNVQPMHPRLDHPNPGWRSRADLSQSTNFRYNLGMNDYPVYQFIKWIYIYIYVCVFQSFTGKQIWSKIWLHFPYICERSSGQFSTWVLTKDWINHCNRIFQVAKDPKWSPEANLNMVTEWTAKPGLCSNIPQKFRSCAIFYIIWRYMKCKNDGSILGICWNSGSKNIIHGNNPGIV